MTRVDDMARGDRERDRGCGSGRLGTPLDARTAGRKRAGDRRTHHPSCCRHRHRAAGDHGGGRSAGVRDRAVAGRRFRLDRPRRPGDRAARPRPLSGGARRGPGQPAAGAGGARSGGSEPGRVSDGRSGRTDQACTSQGIGGGPADSGRRSRRRRDRSEPRRAPMCSAGQAQVNDARAAIDQARAGVDQASANLAHTVIHSPIDGIVIDREFDVGQTVAAAIQAPLLFRIASPLAHVQVQVDIDESDVDGLTPGEPAMFEVEAFPDEMFRGTVRQLRLQPVAEQTATSTPVASSTATPASTVVATVVSYAGIIDVDNPRPAAAARDDGGGRARRRAAGNAPSGFRMARSHSGRHQRRCRCLGKPSHRSWMQRPMPATEPRNRAMSGNTTGRQFTAIAVQVGLADSQSTELLSGPVRPGDALRDERRAPSTPSSPPHPSTPPKRMPGSSSHEPANSRPHNWSPPPTSTPPRSPERSECRCAVRSGASQRCQRRDRPGSRRGRAGVGEPSAHRHPVADPRIVIDRTSRRTDRGRGDSGAILFRLRTPLRTCRCRWTSTNRTSIA